MGFCKNRITISEWCVVTAFFGFFAVFHSLGFWSGEQPFVSFQSSDAIDICSFVAARIDPDSFAGDGILSPSSNLNFYALLHLPILENLTILTGDCGIATILLFLPSITIYLLGFFTLGFLLTGTILWGLLVAVVSLSYFGLNLGEYWGLAYEPLPRFIFAGFLPLFIIQALKLLDRPSSWTFLALIGGILSYVHPPSAATTTAAIILTCLVHAQGKWKTKLLWSAISSTVYFLVITPFLLRFKSSKQIAVPDNIQQSVIAIGPDFYSASTALLSFLNCPGVFEILLAAIFLSILVLLNKQIERTTKRTLCFLLLLGLAVLFTATIVPLVEQVIWNSTGRWPQFRDLIRSLRYLIPLAELIIVMSTAALFSYYGPLYRRLMTILGAVAIILVLPPPVKIFINGVRSTIQQNWIPTEDAVYTQRRLSAIKELYRPGDLAFSTSMRDGLLIRSVNKIPVFWTEKDGGLLRYVSEKALLRWSRLSSLVKNQNWRDVLIELRSADVNIVTSNNKELLQHALLSGMRIKLAPDPSGHYVLKSEETRAHALP